MLCEHRKRQHANIHPIIDMRVTSSATTSVTTVISDCCSGGSKIRSDTSVSVDENQSPSEQTGQNACSFRDSFVHVTRKLADSVLVYVPVYDRLSRRKLRFPNSKEPRTHSTMSKRLSLS